MNLCMIVLRESSREPRLLSLLSIRYDNFSGQTGAGKTYTIVGDCPESGTNLDYRPFLIQNSKGIMVRAMEQIITESRKKRDSRITISFFEVYN